VLACWRGRGGMRVSDIPAPAKQRKPDPLAGHRESDRLSPGAFFAQHKAVVDERRDHLARLGMDERHVDALRMPERHEPPTNVIVAKGAAGAPAEPPEDAPKQKPSKLHMRGDLE
jgi:hypothetical protein